uniref:Uncharacterized protein n=1 Tax=Arundo donax TaxID=35708 RepID=A0A0A9EYJ4_ARUDO
MLILGPSSMASAASCSSSSSPARHSGASLISRSTGSTCSSAWSRSFSSGVSCTGGGSLSLPEPTPTAEDDIAALGCTPQAGRISYDISPL